MATSRRPTVGSRIRPLSGIYIGNFEDSINDVYGPTKIKETGAKFVELERQYGPFVYGKFTKYLLPDRNKWSDKPGSNIGYDDWEKNVTAIPEKIRQQLTDVMGSNLRSLNPLPMFIKVGENLDNSHDLIIRPFTANGVMYIGILILCPNLKWGQGLTVPKAAATRAPAAKPAAPKRASTTGRAAPTRAPATRGSSRPASSRGRSPRGG